MEWLASLASQKPKGPRRVIQDNEGRAWTVREVGTPDGRVLMYDCTRIVRRVRAYPVDWLEWNDESLMALSLRP